MMDFILKPMKFALKLGDFVLKMMDGSRTVTVTLCGMS